MERNRCTQCGEIYSTKEEACPQCGSKENTKIEMPDTPWGDDD